MLPSLNGGTDGEEKTLYGLVLAQEAEWGCVAHKLLQFQVKLYQWQMTAPGIAQHVSTTKKLADILGELLQKAYRPGDELNLTEAEDSTELSDSKDTPSNKSHPRDGERLNEDRTCRLWKGYPMKLRSDGLWWPSRAMVHGIDKLRCINCPKTDPEQFYMNMRGNPFPYTRCIECQGKGYNKSGGTSWVPTVQPPFA